jgi:cytidylate kinase
MNKIIIAIDGLSGCGKSSTAREVARQLGYIYIDSGAFYRAVTLYLIRNHIPDDDKNLLSKVLKELTIEFRLNTETGIQDTYLNGENVEKEIRGIEVSEKVASISALPEVREGLAGMQRILGENKGIVMDGRDIGTIIFPCAELKIFMTADLAIRAHRRLRELTGQGFLAEYNTIAENLRSRDKADSTRTDSPLIKATDAYEIDTSNITFEDQVRLIVNKATGIIISLSRD